VRSTPLTNICINGCRTVSRSPLRRPALQQRLAFSSALMASRHWQRTSSFDDPMATLVSRLVRRQAAGPLTRSLLAIESGRQEMTDICEPLHITHEYVSHGPASLGVAVGPLREPLMSIGCDVVNEVGGSPNVIH
jgi:hypothetical protein